MKEGAILICMVAPGQNPVLVEKFQVPERERESCVGLGLGEGDGE